MLFAQDTRFDLGVQLGSEIGLGIERRWSFANEVDAGFGGGAAVGMVLQSSGLNGVVYRGIATRSIWLQGWATGSAGIGGSLGVTLNLASYELTSLLFFFPEVIVGPTFATRITDRASIMWAIPLSYQFRSDLDVAFSAGLTGRLAVDFRSPAAYF